MYKNLNLFFNSALRVRPEVRNMISKMLAKKVASKRDLEACLREDSECKLLDLTQDFLKLKSPDVACVDG